MLAIFRIKVRPIPFFLEFDISLALAPDDVANSSGHSRLPSLPRRGDDSLLSPFLSIDKGVREHRVFFSHVPDPWPFAQGRRVSCLLCFACSLRRRVSASFSSQTIVFDVALFSRARSPIWGGVRMRFFSKTLRETTFSSRAEKSGVRLMRRNLLASPLFPPRWRLHLLNCFSSHSPASIDGTRRFSPHPFFCFSSLKFPFLALAVRRCLTALEISFQFLPLSIFLCLFSSPLLSAN